MKALVGTFNQQKALEGAFSVIVQLHRLIVYTALDQTEYSNVHPGFACLLVSCFLAASRIMPRPAAAKVVVQITFKVGETKESTQYAAIETKLPIMCSLLSRVNPATLSIQHRTTRSR